MGFNKRVLSKAVSELGKAKAPAKPKDIITDPAGQWKYPGQKTRIPSSDITMQGVNYPVWAQPNIGPGTMMYPNQDYQFPGADYVDETPIVKKGGTLKSKKYSKSMSATNKLFAKNKLFKNKKSKIFDPNAEFKSGGSKLGPINLDPNPLSHYELNYGYNLPIKQDGGVNVNPWLYTNMQENEGRDPGQIIGLGADFQHKSGLHGSTNVELPFFNKDAVRNSNMELGYTKRYKNLVADASLQNSANPYEKINPSLNTGIGYNTNIGKHIGFGVAANNNMVPGKLWNPGIQAGMTYNFQDGGENEDEYMDLTDEEIQAYRDAGYEVDELPEAQEGGPKDTIIYPPGDSEYMNQPALNYDILEMQNQKARRNYEQYLKDNTDPTNIQRTSPSFQQKYFMNKDVDTAEIGGYVQHELVKAQKGKTVKTFNRDIRDQDAQSNTGWSSAPVEKKKVQQTVKQNQAQKSFDKNFKVTDKSKYEKTEDKITSEQQKLKDFGKEKGIPVTNADLENVANQQWSFAGVGPQKQPDMMQAKPEQSNSSRAWEYITNPMTAAEYAISGGGAENMPHNINEMKAAGYDAGVVQGRNIVGNTLNALNPLEDVKSVYEGISDIKKGDNSGYATAGLGLLGFIPGVSEAKGVVKAGNVVHDFAGPLKHSYMNTPEVLNALRQRGKNWDKVGIQGKDLLHKDMINYHGTYHGRPIVEVRMPDGSSEMFYKSSGWAGKEGAGANGTTEGMWQVYGGHANSPQSSNWFIKDKDYQNYYGSNTFKDIADNMDNALIQKHGFSNKNELDDALNFQNRFGDVNTYTPKEKFGGSITEAWEDELDDHTIELLRKAGYTVEELD